MADISELKIASITCSPLDWLSRQSKKSSLLLGILLALIVGVADYLTGYELNFSIFYLIPVSLTAWNAGRQEGILTAGISAAFTVLANFMSGLRYSHPLILCWNFISDTLFFLVIVFAVTALRDAYERERALARKDFLTGIANRQAFHELAEREIERSKRYRRPLSVAFIDCDNFKTVNDTLGHDIGDALLHEVASALLKNLRTVDTAARLGGDEFIVMLPETDAGAADAAVKKIRNILLGTMQDHQWPVTFSIGIATFITPPDSVNELIKMADALMYNVKSGSKDMVRHEVIGK